MPHTDRNDAYFLSESLAADAGEVESYRSSGSLRTPKEKGAAQRLLFSTGSRVFPALDPGIKRYAQTKRLLARRSLGALKRLRDFASAGFLPSQ
jgi:hypothetical protein